MVVKENDTHKPPKEGNGHALPLTILVNMHNMEEMKCEIESSANLDDANYHPSDSISHPFAERSLT